MSGSGSGSAREPWALAHGVLFILFLAIPSFIFAAEKFPSRCRISGLKFSQQSMSLFSQHTAKPRLYAIHNISRDTIWLTHQDKNSGASAGWSSQLSPNHWSAILVTRRNFDLQCHFQKKSGAMISVPCQKMIRACQFSEFYSKNPLSGGFWVTENVVFHALESRIRARGLLSK